MRTYAAILSFALFGNVLPAAEPNSTSRGRETPEQRTERPNETFVHAGIPATEIHVAPDGDDANAGTREAPLQTLAAARDAVRSVAGKETVTVHVADGVYYLPETLVFTSADSGTEEHPVTYVAENEGRAVLSGGTNLQLQWQPYRDGIFQAATPSGLKIDQLFVGGVRQRMARYPNYDATKTTDAYQGYAADAFSKERAAAWADPIGGYIHAMHRSRWNGYHYRITGKTPDGEVSYEGGWQNNRQMGNRRTLIKGCHIHDVGASGVCFVGDPGAVRDPLFEYREKNDLSAIDRTPGPKTNDYPAESSVEDCLIHGVGRVERQPAGVQIAMAMEITVRDTSIYDCARAGINIGDGCWGGHLIERCDVFDTVRETHDHGSFNSWGRDRYWSSDRSASQVEVDADPSLPLLDAMKTTVIRDSRWRCDHGWDIDLDDGSSNYEIYNNLLLGGGLKFREGFRRKAWNNIMVNNSFHPHVWYANSGDEFYSNIVMSDVKGIRAPTNAATGKNIDKNLFFVADPKQKDKYAEQGWDSNSVVGDPLFWDPARGDFRVQDGSPALDIGFESFPMEQFGVKKPSLKALAKTPVIPTLEMGSKDATSPGPPKAAGDVFWLGARLHNLQGEESSAYGTRKEDGKIALIEVPADSEATRCGLKENDLIQAINGHPVTNCSQLFAVLADFGPEAMNVTLVRQQQVTTVALSNTSYVVVETSDTADRFAKLPVPAARIGKATANQSTANQPLNVLADGRLVQDYGPVFRNGVRNGAYKLDLGQPRCVTAISSWSFHQNGKRGVQKLTIYAGKSDADPGWDVSDRDRFTPLGSIDTTGISIDAFQGVSLRAPAGKFLGECRWIIWCVTPVTGLDENTAFQELGVEFAE